MVIHAATIPTLPVALQAVTGDMTCTPVTVGMSGTAVFRLTTNAGETRYLKIAECGAEPLLPEMQRLEWLAGRLPVPRVLSFAQEDGREYLLLSEVPGRMSHTATLAGDIPRIVHLLARGMRMVHAIPSANCPFDMRLDMRIAAARQRVAEGRVDSADFDTIRQGQTAESLLAALLTTRPAMEDLVFTHGDYCPPNILVDLTQDEPSGFIDLGRAGIADRYQDIALAARSLAHNFGARWMSLLFEEYGLDVVDHAKIAYYQLLDEFF